MNMLKREELRDIGLYRSIILGGSYVLYNVLIILSLVVIAGQKSFLIYLISIVVFVLAYEIYARVTNKYYIEPITHSLEKINGRKLIHYTNKLTEEELAYYEKTGYVKLKGSTSARSNYVMKFRDKKKKFVWFHLENLIQKNEPNLQSFLFTHSVEKRPRKYKIIIDPIHLRKEVIYLRPDNNNIVVLGDIEVPGKIETSFNWYNNKLYLRDLFKSELAITLLPFFYYSLQQVIGSIIDLYFNRKKKYKKAKKDFYQI
jgi:hypothetical protein